MALAITGLRRIVANLPIRYKLLAFATATAALSLVILSAPLIFYYRDIVSAQHQQAFALAAIIAAIVAVLAASRLSILVQRTITRPLNLLTGIIEEVSQGQDYTLSVPRTSADEIGILSDGVNFMLRQLERQHRELE